MGVCIGKMYEFISFVVVFWDSAYETLNPKPLIRFMFMGRIRGSRKGSFDMGL